MANFGIREGRGSTFARKSRALGATGPISVRLTHLPTGVEVVGERPRGHYSRKQQQQLRDELELQLLDELTLAVAKHKRTPGL